MAENPTMPHRTAARILRQQHPAMFKSIEAARDYCRRVTGNHGKRDRGKRKQRPPGKPGAVDPLDLLPPALKELGDANPFVIKSERVLALFDVHIPYHEPVPLRVALEHGHAADVDHILLGGDILDCYAVSRWQTNPEERDFDTELMRTREFLSVLRAKFPDVPISYLSGNHEDRWRRYMWSIAPALTGVTEFKLESLLKFADFNITPIPDLHRVDVGKLNVIHGHEVRISAAVNPARGLFLKARESAMCGHLHRTSEHHGNSLTRQHPVACFSVGALCNLSPRYNPMGNDWNHGFAVIEHSPKTGHFRVHNHRIIDGAVY